MEVLPGKHFFFFKLPVGAEPSKEAQAGDIKCSLLCVLAAATLWGWLGCESTTGPRLSTPVLVEGGINPATTLFGFPQAWNGLSIIPRFDRVAAESNPTNMDHALYSMYLKNSWAAAALQDSCCWPSDWTTHNRYQWVKTAQWRHNHEKLQMESWIKRWHGWRPYRSNNFPKIQILN